MIKGIPWVDKSEIEMGLTCKVGDCCFCCCFWGEEVDSIRVLAVVCAGDDDVVDVACGGVVSDCWI